MAWPKSLREVQPTSGSDNNPGIFVPLTGGVDRTNLSTITLDGTTVYLTSAGAQTTAVLVGRVALASDVGNGVRISAGTNATPALYYISAVNTGTNTWTLIPVAGSGNWCTGAVPNGSGKFGGPLATISQLITDTYSGSSTIFVKGESTIEIAAGLTFSTSAVPTNSAAHTRISGYGSVRGDGTQATIQGITNAGITLITLSGSGFLLENFILDSNSLNTSTGLLVSGGYSTVYNIKALNFKTRGIYINSACDVLYCEATGGISGASGGLYSDTNSAVFMQCYSHSNVCVGFAFANLGVAINCIAHENSGTGSNGFSFGYGHVLIDNISNASGQHAFACISGNTIQCLWKGNIAANAGRSSGSNAATAYGFVGNANGTGMRASWAIDGNAYYNNLTAARVNMDDTSGLNAYAPYTNVLDVALTASPFVNAGVDFGLNATAGGGAACKNTGPSKSWPGLASTVGYPDMGSVQANQPPIQLFITED